MFNLLIVSNIIMVGAFLLKINSLPPQIPLFFSNPPGEAQLGDLWMIIFLPLIVDLFFYFNNYFSKKFFPDNKFVKTIVDYFNLFLIIGITLIFVRIIFYTS